MRKVLSLIIFYQLLLDCCFNINSGGFFLCLFVIFKDNHDVSDVPDCPDNSRHRTGKMKDIYILTEARLAAFEST